MVISSVEAGILDSGLIQLGFAGMCLILLAMLFWTIRQLLDANRRSDSVMAKLTDAIKSVDKTMDHQMSTFKEAQINNNQELRKLTDALNLRSYQHDKKGSN